jgi:carboxyl-terminal processing protease
VGFWQREALRGVLESLDPDSTILEPPADNHPLPRGPASVGVSLRREPDGPLTIIPNPDGPASRAGIQRGDHLFQINDARTDAMTTQAAISRVTGDDGSAVTLWVERPGEAAPMRFDLRREPIATTTVRATVIGAVGVLRIDDFLTGTAEVCRRKLLELAQRGAHAWVLDLRANRSVSNPEMLKLAKLFVDRGPLVSYVGRSRRETPITADELAFDRSSPLVVLAGAGTHSAPVLLAAILHARGRAVLAGTTISGPTVTLNPYSYPDGAQLHLLSGHWHQANEPVTDRVELAPDVWIDTAPAARPGPAIVLPPAPPVSAPPPEQAADTELDDPVLRAAAELAAGTPAATAQLQVAADARGVAALTAAGIDWTAGEPGDSALEVALTTPRRPLHPGEPFTLTLQVTNRGRAPAWRVQAELHTDLARLASPTLAIGKLAPGETRTVTLGARLPDGAHDNADQIIAKVHAGGGAPVTAAPLELDVVAEPIALSYRYQSIDAGVLVTVENAGDAIAAPRVTVLSNAPAGVTVTQPSRSLGELAPGATKSIEIPVVATKPISGAERALQIEVGDERLPRVDPLADWLLLPPGHVDHAKVHDDRWVRFALTVDHDTLHGTITDADGVDDAVVWRFDHGQLHKLLYQANPGHLPHLELSAKIAFVPGRNDLIIAARHGDRWYYHDQVVYR